MKKRFVVINLVIVFLFILSCTPSIPEVVEENSATESVSENIQQAEETPAQPEVPATETAPVIETPSVEETKSSEPEFQIIYPKLKYEGAYNGPLYATSEQIGDSAPMNKHFQNMDRNGVNFMIAFFGIELEDIFTDLGYVMESVKDHPRRIVPFFSPGMGSEETKPFVGEKLTSIYKDTLAKIKKTAGGNFIQGFGEIEQYAWNMQPNDPKLLLLYDLAKENNLAVMFHPAQGRSTAVKALIEKYPSTTFLIHMFPEDFEKDRQKYIDILKTHNNIYFSVDVDHMMFDGDTGLLYKYQDLPLDQAKEKFIADYDKNEQTLLTIAFNRYKPLIEAVPDKVMWGTEGGTDYVYEPEVYDRMIKFTRLFLGKLLPEQQEKIGYKNALRVFGEGAVLENN